MFKLSVIRAEFKEEKNSINACFGQIYSAIESGNCKEMKSLFPDKKSDAQLLSTRIYEDMEIGQSVVTKRCTYVRKPSSDLVIRWFVKHQDEIITLIDERKEEIEKERIAKKEAEQAEKEAKKAEKAAKKAEKEAKEIKLDKAA